MKLTFLLLVFSASLLAQSGPVNLGFEDGPIGGVPEGWFVPSGIRKAGGSAELTDQNPKSGKRSAKVTYAPNGSEIPFGNLMQSFDAAPYRGKAIRFRAAVRTAGGCRAQMWLRVDRENKSMGLFDNMQDRPILSAEWQYYDITGDVDSDAQSLNIGLMVMGSCSAWIDDATFVVTGESRHVPAEPARPLTSRGLENLTAFARLLGYVRHFHPGNEAAAADWESFAIEGARAVEDAGDADELAKRLSALFRPVAPTVRVFPNGRPADPPSFGPAKKIIRWSHTGLGSGAAKTPYHSERIIEDTASGVPAPFRADVGAGVSSIVPLALPAEAIPDAAPSHRPGAGSGNDRATRLAAVMLAWNIFEHFYPYFDVVKTDWHAELSAALRSAATDNDQEAFLLTLRRMVAALHDGHGGVYLIRARRQAAPPVMWDWIEGRVVVTAVLKPQGLDLAPGDIVLAIDGIPAAEALARREALISGATPQWIRFNALKELAAGPEGTAVTLRIDPFREPGKVREVKVQRDTMTMALSEPRPDKVREIEPGIFYVNIDQINDQDWQEALPRLEKAKGIVFDFRGYPRNLRNAEAFFGTLSEQQMTSAQWLIPQVTVPDHSNMQFQHGGEWQLKPGSPYLKAKKVFLIDGRAISYAESCLGIVEHYKLGEIVGGPTAGTNGNVNPIVLPGGYNLSWTGMKVLKHDGSRHHGVGILPTIPAGRTREGIAAGRDEILERGIEALKAPGRAEAAYQHKLDGFFGLALISAGALLTLAQRMKPEGRRRQAVLASLIFSAAIFCAGVARVAAIFMPWNKSS
jgi:C-terminal processing protease CtpA/Prc